MVRLRPEESGEDVPEETEQPTTEGHSDYAANEPSDNYNGESGQVTLTEVTTGGDIQSRPQILVLPYFPLPSTASLPINNGNSNTSNASSNLHPQYVMQPPPPRLVQR